ncbi:MAG: hypothetical protein V2J62_11370, partial [candidate division KSB1 bacterium]|nr:hypothetical protein [candidate division KSB1 bacterium]
MRKTIFYTLVTCVVITGCSGLGDRQPLPTATSPYTSFGANDTTYIRLQPDWDAARTGYNFSRPVDIVVGRDGYLFVADQGNEQVVVFNKSGELQSHSGLDNITGVTDLKAVAIDSRMNLYLVNGTNKVYVWNQYLNYSGVDSVAVKYVLRDTLTNELFEYNYVDAGEAVYDSTLNLVLEKFIFSGDAGLIDSTLGISVFYEDEFADTQFDGIAAAPFGKEYIYVTDSGNNR